MKPCKLRTSQLPITGSAWYIIQAKLSSRGFTITSTTTLRYPQRAVDTITWPWRVSGNISHTCLATSIISSIRLCWCTIPSLLDSGSKRSSKRRCRSTLARQAIFYTRSIISMLSRGFHFAHIVLCVCIQSGLILIRHKGATKIQIREVYCWGREIWRRSWNRDSVYHALHGLSQEKGKTSAITFHRWWW